jgi:hypothetical protein
MTRPYLEEVFKRSGLPTYTFVEPKEYQHLQVALRTPGRGLVIEGPSGIGKTTAVLTAIDKIGMAPRAQKLSARRLEDREIIAALPSIHQAELVVIDDFHRLDDPTKHAIADLMKDLADGEDQSTKIVLLGINKAGDTLVNFASDLNNRIDTIHFEVNSTARVRELIHKGEQALNITIKCADALATDAGGSFHIAQILSHEICLAADVSEQCSDQREIPHSVEAVKDRVLAELSRTFLPQAIRFARGRRFQRVGRAPYLHLLRWLADSDQWTLSITQAIALNPKSRGSVSQIVDKGHLQSFLAANPELHDILHFDSYTKVLGVEDPKFMYFLRNLLWSKFVREVGYLTIEFRSRYDFALSFAGEDRQIVEKLKLSLQDEEIEVFYDKDEQHRILASDVEEYLAPIYRTEARFIIPLLSRNYPKKIWTKFESQQFKARFGESSVIPIWFADAPSGIFDESARVGGLVFDPTADADAQIANITEVLLKRVGDERQLEEAASDAREDAGNAVDVDDGAELVAPA